MIYLIDDKDNFVLTLYLIMTNYKKYFPKQVEKRKIKKQLKKDLDNLIIELKRKIYNNDYSN